LLRVREPNIERPFKVKFLPFVATAGILCNLYLMWGLRTETKLSFLIWGTLGIIVYFAYSRGHSNLNKK